MPQAKLVVRRDSKDDIKMRNLEVLVDGKWRADLQFGEAFETELAPGDHEVLITNKLKKEKAEFVVCEGETAVFTGTNVLSKGPSALLGGLGMIVYHPVLKRIS
jgi:hypothetical protein